MRILDSGFLLFRVVKVCDEVPDCGMARNPSRSRSPCARVLHHGIDFVLKFPEVGFLDPSPPPRRSGGAKLGASRHDLKPTKKARWDSEAPRPQGPSEKALLQNGPSHRDPLKGDSSRARKALKPCFCARHLHLLGILCQLLGSTFSGVP